MVVDDSWVETAVAKGQTNEALTIRHVSAFEQGKVGAVSCSEADSNRRRREVANHFW